MSVVYTQSAIADIDQIFSYIAERNPRAAVAVVDTVEATVARIGSFPLSAASTDEPDVRMAPAGRYPYVIFYTVNRDEVRILRIMHTARMRPWEGPDEETKEEG